MPYWGLLHGFYLFLGRDEQPRTAGKRKPWCASTVCRRTWYLRANPRWTNRYQEVNLWCLEARLASAEPPCRVETGLNHLAVLIGVHGFTAQGQAPIQLRPRAATSPAGPVSVPGRQEKSPVRGDPIPPIAAGDEDPSSRAIRGPGSGGHGQVAGQHDGLARPGREGRAARRPGLPSGWPIASCRV